MTLGEFIRSTTAESPPQDLTPALHALWHDKKGNWERAHELAQEAAGADGDWVHAYLHRKEGDKSNARYWYNRANKPEMDGSLEEEWERIAESLLGH